MRAAKREHEERDLEEETGRERRTSYAKTQTQPPQETTIATPPRKNTNLSESTPNDPDKEQHAEDLHDHYEDLLRMMGRISPKS